MKNLTSVSNNFLEHLFQTKFMTLRRHILIATTKEQTEPC